MRLERQPIIAGLYGLTQDTLKTDELLAKVEQALSGGMRHLQYRNKQATPELQLEQALALRRLTKAYGCILIINDSLGLALATAADGIHFGRDDSDPLRVRKDHPDLIIGVSCYNDMARAIYAAQSGASYIALGSFFPSHIKPDAARATIDLLLEAKQRLDLPVVAIGGITLQTAPSLIDAGANAVAVITALFDVSDIKCAAQEFTNLFS